jgi:hypothetical protein
MRVGDGEGGRQRGRARRRRETALRVCRGGAARQRGAAPRVGEEGRVGDGHGEERRWRGWEHRGRTTRFGGKRLSALEGDEAYIKRPPFVTVRITNRDKSPFNLRSYYEPRLKAPLLSLVASRPVTKGAFRAGCPEGEFSPFCHDWCYHP